jgi:hypothetical protein
LSLQRVEVVVAGELRVVVAGESRVVVAGESRVVVGVEIDGVLEKEKEEAELTLLASLFSSVLTRTC